LPAVKEFGEPSTKLEFDVFNDDTEVDGVQPGNVDGGEDEKKVDDSEPKSKKTKSPTVDEYQWQWKASDLGSRFARQGTDQTHSPSSKLPDAHSSCSLCLSQLTHRFPVTPH
jgi:hypothetical protein